MRTTTLRILPLALTGLLGCPDDAPTQADTTGPPSSGSTASAPDPSTSPPPTLDGTGDGTGDTSASGATGGSTDPSSAGSGSSTGVSATTGERPPRSFTVVTFNTGTTPGLAHGSDGDAYGQDQADLSDEHYGNGLAWQVHVDQTAAFFAELQPDIVAFQELFHSPDCLTIPPAAHPGFVCETWQPGDPTVVEQIMGPGYQIACHLGRPDKCVAVRQRFGRIVGCDEDLCLDGLDGVPIPDCGGGSRVGRGVIEQPDGEPLTVVSLHGTSGLLPEDWICREQQIEQIFVDFDGQPAVNGRRNLVLGDLNTDPYRAVIDPSAARWLDFVGPDRDFWFISEAGPMATPTYNGLFNIDHVISDHFMGRAECIVPGITPGEDPVLNSVYFDHRPIICTVTER